MSKKLVNFASIRFASIQVWAYAKHNNSREKYFVLGNLGDGKLGPIAYEQASNRYRKVGETWENNSVNFPVCKSHILISYDQKTD